VLPVFVMFLVFVVVANTLQLWPLHDSAEHTWDGAASLQSIPRVHPNTHLSGLFVGDKTRQTADRSPGM
jgi:hypothetical protein